MKSLTTTLLLILCFPFSVICQSGAYTLDGDKEISLLLFDGYYCIDIDDSFDDVISWSRISFGTYECGEEKILLHDVLLNFVMEMDVDKDKRLVMKKGFHFLNGKTFVFDHKLEHWSWERTINDYKENISDFCIHQYPDTIYNCDSGWYAFMSFQAQDGLHIIENKHFEYTISDNVLLSGEIQRVGNILILKDDIIEEPFLILIEKDGMVPFLPHNLGLWKYQLLQSESTPNQ